MKQLLYPILTVLGISLVIIHPLVALIVIAIPVVLVMGFLLFLTSGINKREKEIGNYLNECDEKLKKGKMTKEENEDIHFYYECGYNY